jgi:hypothetical protein
LEEEAVIKALALYRRNRIIKKYIARIEQEIAKIVDEHSLPNFSFA